MFQKTKKQKKEVSASTLMKPLISYENVKAINNFIQTYWNQRKYFFSDYFYIRPKLNQSLKWRYDYIFLVKNKAYNKRWKIY